MVYIFCRLYNGRLEVFPNRHVSHRQIERSEKHNAPRPAGYCREKNLKFRGKKFKRIFNKFLSFLKAKIFRFSRKFRIFGQFQMTNGQLNFGFLGQ